ncbi:MAG: PP2C family protein-serine/threonine phosphatase [Anaerolineae bacterium]|nr:PP2C family protein-serine/threonine phosphatase [Anaerolineae bacterium]
MSVYPARLIKKFLYLRVPLVVKILTPLVLLIVITVGVSGYRVYRESTDRWQVEMDTRLVRVATLVADNLSRETLMSIRNPSDIDSPAYQQIVNQLEQAVLAGNIAWIGIYYREDDHFYYWVDYDYSGAGYPFFYATLAHTAAYVDKQPHTVTYTDEFGSYYGFVAPIIVTNEAGETEVIGLVEALVDQESRYLLQQDTLKRILPILLGGSLLAIVMAIVITVIVFNQPLRHLQRGAIALSEGQFGYTIPLISRDELGDLASTFNQMSIQLEELYRDQAEQERMRHELEIARQVQQAIFPADLPQLPGLQVAAFCRPQQETSGDFYDLFLLGDNQVGVVVGDVLGKSLPAAMLMLITQSTIRAEAHNFATPDQVLNESNDILVEKIFSGMFAAVSYARLDVQRKEMVWANAGQVYPFLLCPTKPPSLDNPRYLVTEGESLPLGMVTPMNYQLHCLPLSPGDIILFYTDGIVEAMNPAGELYGFDRLVALVQSLPADLSPQILVEAVVADVTTFVGPAQQHDDMTMVAIKLLDIPPASA